MSKIEALQSNLLGRFHNIKHGFFTRNGGVSKGIYQSLNVGIGSNDVAESVIENRIRVAKYFGVNEASLATLHQIHSSKIHVITHERDVRRCEADAIVTDQKNIAIGVLTADCVSVLFADDGAGIIAASHAGWKGAMGGIIENTVAQMVNLGAKKSNITASIGACIGKDSYEVGCDFSDAFLEESPNNSRFFAQSNKIGHQYFDIRGYVSAKLKIAGVSKIDHINHDTLQEESLFFSYRRSRLRGEGDYGRQISAIMMS